MRHALFALALLPIALAAEPFFITYEQALSQSAKEQKSILIYSEPLSNEESQSSFLQNVLQSPLFIESVRDQFVCCKLMGPEYASVRDNLKIKAIPTLLVLNSEAQEVSRLAYMSTDPSELAADLKYIADGRTQLQLRLPHLEILSACELKQTYELASKLSLQEEQETILEAGVCCEDPGFFLLELYRLISQKSNPSTERLAGIKQSLFEIDPNNKLGYHYNLALIDFQMINRAQNKEISLAAKVKPLKEYLESFGLHDAEHAWQIEMILAEFFLEEDCWNTALNYAERAKNDAPESKKVEMNKMLDYIRANGALTVSN